MRLIVNAIDKKQMAALKLNVDDVMDAVGLPLLGIVPYDPGVTLSCAAGKPLQSKKNAGNATERIASRIQGIQTAVPSRL
jgi:septum site-determining protein MinD